MINKNKIFEIQLVKLKINHLMSGTMYMLDSQINGQNLIFPCFNYTAISLIAYWIHETTQEFRLSFGRMLHVPRITYSANEHISSAFLLLCEIILAYPPYKRLYACQLVYIMFEQSNLALEKFRIRELGKRKVDFKTTLIRFKLI